MIGTDVILKISTVLVSLGVVLAPILYPRYSLFMLRATQAVQQLKQVRKERENVKVGYIEQGEYGFKELNEVMERAFRFNGQAQRFCLAMGAPPDLGEFTGFGMSGGTSDNGVFYAETEDGERELLIWEPWNAGVTRRLERVLSGISIRAKERSHTITVFLAVIWSTLSIVLVI